MDAIVLDVAAIEKRDRRVFVVAADEWISDEGRDPAEGRGIRVRMFPGKSGRHAAAVFHPLDGRSCAEAGLIIVPRPGSKRLPCAFELRLSPDEAWTR